MKINKKLIGIVLIFILIICSLSFSVSKNEIRTIKSEKQLEKIYESTDEPLPFIVRLLTMPFSIIYEDSYRNRRYGTYYEVEDTIRTNDIAESAGTKTTTKSSSKDYSKTNIQVEGVDEADIIKTDGDYIYSISDESVVITNASNPEELVIESKINNGTSIPNDLILYKDKIVIISTKIGNISSYNQDTVVEIYDISNKKEPKLLKSFELDEPYYTTRCINGKLYVFSRGYLRKENDKIDRSYSEDGKTKEISLNNIKYLKNNVNNTQTLIAELDLNNIKDITLNSYLIDISNAYISENNIYLLDAEYDNDKIKISSLFTFKGVIGFINSVNDDYNYEQRTKIYKFNITDNKGVKLQKASEIKGRTINQYSLDEKDGNLRIAHETTEGTMITVLDKNLNAIGKTEALAKGEKMYSSRFMGDKAYLVTYRNTDPLFVIDLSDVKNPQVMGELKIPGYSNYLHPYDEPHLIGFGMETKEFVNKDNEGKVISSWVRVTGMKMSLFDVSDINNPKEIAKTTIGDSRTVSAILTNPKALLFSKDKNLLAIPVNNYSEDFELDVTDDTSEEESRFINYNKDVISEGYFVYNIDLENGFELKGTITHNKTLNRYYYYNRSKLLRGLYIDDDLYTVSEDSIKVNKLSDLEQISELKIKNKGEN